MPGCTQWLPGHSAKLCAGWPVAGPVRRRPLSMAGWSLLRDCRSQDRPRRNQPQQFLRPRFRRRSRKYRSKIPRQSLRTKEICGFRICVWRPADIAHRDLVTRRDCIWCRQHRRPESFISPGFRSYGSQGFASWRASGPLRSRFELSRSRPIHQEHFLAVAWLNHLRRERGFCLPLKHSRQSRGLFGTDDQKNDA